MAKIIDERIERLLEEIKASGQPDTIVIASKKGDKYSPIVGRTRIRAWRHLKLQGRILCAVVHPETLELQAIISLDPDLFIIDDNEGENK